MPVTFINVPSNERKEYSHVTFHLNVFPESRKNTYEVGYPSETIVIAYSDVYRIYDDLMHKIIVIPREKVVYVEYDHSVGSYEQDKQERVKNVKEIFELRKRF